MQWNPEIAVSTAAFDGYPLRRALERLASVPDTSIELAYIAGYVEDFSEELFSETNADKIRRLLSETNSLCSGVSAHTDLASEGGLDRGLRRIRFTAAIGAARVVSNAAPVAYRDVFLKNLEEFAKEAERVGVELLLENPGDGRTNVVDNGATAADVVSRFKGSAIGINYDFGNVISHFQERVRPEEDWLPVRSSVSYFHIKDVGVADGSDSGEAATSGDSNHGDSTHRENDHADGTGAPERVWLYPEIGTGMIDYSSILPMIAEDAVVPALGIELPLRLRRSVSNPAGRTPTPLDEEEIIGIVRRSVSFVRNAIGSNASRK
jgi:sugar phosphate isomerase/epimerase